MELVMKKYCVHCVWVFEWHWDPVLDHFVSNEEVRCACGACWVGHTCQRIRNSTNTYSRNLYICKFILTN